MPSFKEKVSEQSKRHLLKKMEALNLALNEMTESVNTETKSSAGDKHETARARMQFEQAKLNGQIEELNFQIKELERAAGNVLSFQVVFGSLSYTNQGIFYISTAIGKIQVDGKEVFVISPQSPLALALKGLKANDKLSFNGVEYKILDIA